jgi:hypothetical protein
LSPFAAGAGGNNKTLARQNTGDYLNSIAIVVSFTDNARGRSMTSPLVPPGLRRQRPTKRSRRSRLLQLEQLGERLVLDTSAPVILQYFEGSSSTIEQRVPDIFNAGYGAVLTPPPGRGAPGTRVPQCDTGHL